MPILAYCVSLAQEYLNAPPVGVAQATIFEMEDLGLRAWYSEVEEGTFSGAENVTRAALDFHHFVSAVFREGVILPFRFPTILESVEELQSHLEAKAAWYTNALHKMDGLAQFEARIISRIKLPSSPESGQHYLDQRKQVFDRVAGAAAALLKGTEDYLREHHLKETQQGTRVYLLFERARTPELREAMKSIAVPDGIEIRLTGPWPPTEFLPGTEEEP